MRPRGLHVDAVSPPQPSCKGESALESSAHLGDRAFSQAGETKVGFPFLSLDFFSRGSLLMPGKEINVCLFFFKTE